MRKSTKEYSFNGLAGCVLQRISRESKKLVGLYHSEQSGMESDPELPWTTVCEEHGTLVSHVSLTIAKEHVGFPSNWCDDCRDNLKSKESGENSDEKKFQNPTEPVL